MGVVRGRDQFSQLRRRFILIASGSFSLALLIICVTINLWNYQLVGKRADDMVSLIHESGEVPSEPPQDGSPYATDLRIDAETPFQTRYFTVTLDEDGGLEALDASHIAAIEDSEMVTMAREALESGRERGYLGSYRFAVFDEGKSLAVVVLDCARDMDAFELFLAVSIAVCGASTATLITLMPRAR